MIIDGTNGLTFNNSTTQASAGKVLQVVQGTYSTSVSTSSTSLVDTGLTASITPKFATSKILVSIHHPNFDKSDNTGWILSVYRNSTEIAKFAPYMFYTASAGRTTSYATKFTLDAPATTSAVTYSTKYAVYAGGTVYMSGVSEIILMEIAS